MRGRAASRGIAALILALAAGPALADCAPPGELLFACEFPERKARVEICRLPGGALDYAYISPKGRELSFRADSGIGGVKDHVQGIHGPAYATALSNGGTVYAVFVDGALMNLDGEGQERNSPNPAVLQVYGSEQDFNEYKQDKPIQRRVCYPPSIRIDHENFGPG